jgi:hypothetical protein
MPKETLRIDSQILEPWREIAGILFILGLFAATS